MNRETEDIFEEIKEILAKNEDAVKGYHKASENADSSTLTTYFREKASKREEFNTNLRREIKGAYTDFDESGSFSGTIHRAWMDIKNLFSADSDEAMLAESITGDKAAIDEYDDVIKYENLPMGLKNLLIAQRDEIQRDIAKNDTLESIQ